MRIELIFKNDVNKYIDMNYQYQISSMIYNILRVDEKYSSDLHNSIRNKEFCFSNIISDKIKRNKNLIAFLSDEIKLEISSLNKQLIQKLYDGFLMFDKYQISSLNLGLKSINIQNQLIEDAIFKSMTPIIINKKTMSDKYEQYLSPLDSDYEKLFFDNLKNKLKLNNEDKYRLHILSTPKSKLIDIKGIKNKGWLFDFKIEAPNNILEIGYYNGFGCKNSQGFGYTKIMNI